MKKLDEGDKERIREMHEDGMSERSIAAAIGCSRSAVWAVIQKSKQAVVAAVLAIAFIVPTATNAAVYEYVNTSGQLASVEASSLAEAETLAPDRAPNSGFLLSSAASAPAPSSSTDTIAALRAQIASLQAQLAALLVQQEGSAAPTGDAITEDMAKNDEEVASSTPEQAQAKRAAARSERAAKKEQVRERAVAIARAHIYAEEEKIHVSLSDFVQGDEVSVAASLNGESYQAETNDQDCGGRIAGSDLILCSLEVVFSAPAEGLLDVRVEVEGVAKTYSITRDGRSGWLTWD